MSDTAEASPVARPFDFAALRIAMAQHDFVVDHLVASVEPFRGDGKDNKFMVAVNRRQLEGPFQFEADAQTVADAFNGKWAAALAAVLAVTRADIMEIIANGPTP